MTRHDCKCIHCGRVTGWTPDPARVGTVCHDCGWKKRFEEGTRKRIASIAQKLVATVDVNLRNYMLTGDRLDIVNMTMHVDYLVDAIERETAAASGWDWA